MRTEFNINVSLDYTSDDIVNLGDLDCSNYDRRDIGTAIKRRLGFRLAQIAEKVQEDGYMHGGGDLYGDWNITIKNKEEHSDNLEHIITIIGED